MSVEHKNKKCATDVSRLLKSLILLYFSHLSVKNITKFGSRYLVGKKTLYPNILVGLILLCRIKPTKIQGRKKFCSWFNFT